MRFYYCVIMIFLLACGKPEQTSELSSGSDTIPAETVSLETTELTENEKQWATHLDKFLKNFEFSSTELPSVSYSYSNEFVNYQVDYYFEDDYLIWVHSHHSEEGGVEEDNFIHKEPEGTYYLSYSRNEDGAFGYEGMDGGEWYKISTDKDYKPFVSGAGVQRKYEFETEFAEIMTRVRTARDSFQLENGYYTYVPLSREYEGAYGKTSEDKTYKFSEVLFTSNLLSPTKFNPEQIKSYLNWWYPLYEEDGKFYRHKVCDIEDYIKISVAAGNYRWEDNARGKSREYLIEGFEESEGDAFYATLNQQGNRIRKTVVKSPEEEGILYIDGRVYTSEPEKYNLKTITCDESH